MRISILRSAEHERAAHVAGPQGQGRRRHGNAAARCATEGAPRTFGRGLRPRVCPRTAEREAAPGHSAGAVAQVWLGVHPMDSRLSSGDSEDVSSRSGPSAAPWMVNARRGDMHEGGQLSGGSPTLGPPSTAPGHRHGSIRVPTLTARRPCLPHPHRGLAATSVRVSLIRVDRSLGGRSRVRPCAVNPAQAHPQQEWAAARAGHPATPSRPRRRLGGNGRCRPG